MYEDPDMKEAGLYIENLSSLTSLSLPCSFLRGVMPSTQGHNVYFHNAWKSPWVSLFPLYAFCPHIKSITESY